MPNMTFLCEKTNFDITATEFCNLFALVIDQDEDPDNQVSIKFLKEYKTFDEGDEFCLDDIEKRSVFGSLGIEVTIPNKKSKNQSGSIIIGGSVKGTNMVIGNDNECNHTCSDGNNLTTVISGSGIIISNKTK